MSTPTTNRLTDLPPGGPVTSLAATPQHAQSPAANCDTPSGRTPAAERKRQQRERERLAQRQTYFSRPDWTLFISPRTLSQKAGCQPGDLRQLVLRELVDNALDAGASAIVVPVGDGWAIADDGAGLDPDDVPHLFCVNRVLVSSKQLRLPSRGLVGNGLRVVMGAVAAFEGTLSVETRGRRLTLAVDRDTGLTKMSRRASRAGLGGRPTCHTCCNACLRRAVRKKRRIKDLTCTVCKEEFATARKDAKYCSGACRQWAYRLREFAAVSP